MQPLAGKWPFPPRWLYYCNSGEPLCEDISQRVTTFPDNFAVYTRLNKGMFLFILRFICRIMVSAWATTLLQRGLASRLSIWACKSLWHLFSYSSFLLNNAWLNKTVCPNRSHVLPSSNNLPSPLIHSLSDITSIDRSIAGVPMEPEGKIEEVVAYKYNKHAYAIS